jgi:hypothetical protein
MTPERHRLPAHSAKGAVTDNAVSAAIVAVLVGTAFLSLAVCIHMHAVAISVLIAPAMAIAAFASSRQWRARKTAAPRVEGQTGAE